MSIKVYLAGGWFENEDDWRYRVVKGLNANPPMAPWMSFQKWGALERAIFGCFDFIGPYPVEITHQNLYLIRKAIEDADIVFAWINNLAAYEISKVSSEISYAFGLKKLVGVGSTSYENDSLSNAWFAYDFASYFPFGYISESPKDSLIECLSSLVEFLPLEQQLQFSKLPQAKKFIEADLSRGGYVYIVKADTGHCKIGRSNNVPQRMKLFSVKLPFEFELIHHFPCEDMHHAEDDLHAAFRDKRCNGEWFNLTDADIATLKRVSSWSSMSLFSAYDDDDLLPELHTDEISEKYVRLYRSKERPYDTKKYT